MNLILWIEKKVRNAFKNSRRFKTFQLNQQIAQHMPWANFSVVLPSIFCPLLHVSSQLKGWPRHLSAYDRNKKQWKPKGNKEYLIIYSHNVDVSHFALEKCPLQWSHSDKNKNPRPFQIFRTYFSRRDKKTVASVMFLSNAYIAIGEYVIIKYV